MRLYVEKEQGLTFEKSLCPIPTMAVKGYNLCYDDGKDVTKDKFTSIVDLITYLSKRPVYDGKMFPVELLSIKEFVTMGYSIYM